MITLQEFEQKAAHLEAILKDLFAERGWGTPKPDFTFGTEYIKVHDDGVWGGGATVTVHIGVRSGEVTVEVSWPTTHYSPQEARKVIAQHERAVEIAEAVLARAAEL